MPDVASGLEEGGAAPLDPFAAALEAKGVTGGGDSATLDIASGLTYAGQNDPDPDADLADDTSGDVTDADLEADDDLLHDDPEINALLKRYDGDADKALKAAVEAQKLIGRQGNELGQSRKETQELAERLARLEGRLEATSSAPAPQILNEEQISTLVEQQGGLAAATWAANNAPDQLFDVLAEWEAQGGSAVQIMRFDRDYQAWVAAEAAKNAPAPEPSRAEQRAAREEASEALGVVMQQVTTEFSDFEEFKDFVPAALEASGKFVAQGIASGDPEQQTEALRIVYERAQRLYASEQRKQATADAEAAAKARGTASKAAARVIQSSSGTPATPKTDRAAEGQSRDDAVAAFKASILSAETTSVADGLTYAGQKTGR